MEKSGHFTGKNKLKSHPQRYFKVDLGIAVDLKKKRPTGRVINGCNAKGYRKMPEDLSGKG